MVMLNEKQKWRTRLVVVAALVTSANANAAVNVSQAGPISGLVCNGPDTWCGFDLSTPLKTLCNTTAQTRINFDSSKPGGKNVLSILMAAQMAGKNVQVAVSDATCAGGLPDSINYVQIK